MPVLLTELHRTCVTVPSASLVCDMRRPSYGVDLPVSY